jgi:hypothetical protein
MKKRLRQLSRAIQSLKEPLPDTPIKFDAMVNQAGKDIVAAEKLQALDTRKREIGKPTQERYRREVRVAS